MLTAPLSSPGSHLVLAQSKMPSDQFSLFDWPVGSNSWTELQLDNARIEQIVDFNSQFIVMDDHQRLYILHLAPQLRLQELETIWCLDECPFIIKRPWLVACGDMLLMVGVEVSLFGPHVYEAYHLNMSTKPASWVDMRKLENYALFLRVDVRSPPFSCMSPARWGGRSSCLYCPSNNQSWSLHGLSMWDLSANQPLFTRNNYRELQALWMYPSMFY